MYTLPHFIVLLLLPSIALVYNSSVDVSMNNILIVYNEEKVPAKRRALVLFPLLMFHAPVDAWRGCSFCRIDH